MCRRAGRGRVKSEKRSRQAEEKAARNTDGSLLQGTLAPGSFDVESLATARR
jgi:hypothetical protein